MRLLTILAAVLFAVVGFMAAQFIQAGSRTSAQVDPHVTRAVTRPKAPVSPFAATNRVRLGIISYNLPLFEQKTGIRPVLTAKYTNWGTPFPTAEVLADHRLGATTLIVLEPRPIGPRRLTAGRGDGYLARWAAAERKLGLPILLSFAPEANGIWYPWGKGHISSALYVKMYHHVHNVLLRDGVRHVTWLWQVDRISAKTERLSLLWPGRAYVNVVGLDGQLASGTSTFDEVFGPTLAQVRAFTRAPVMLSEVGVGKGPARARQITSLFGIARREHLTALNFFDVKTWNFDNDPAALRALRAAARAR